MLRRKCIGVLAIGLAVTGVTAGEALETSGRVDSVTVYRGQALVTRVIEIPAPGGLREVVITDLPEKVQPGSIFADSADGVEVRSVRYRVRPVSQDVREEVRKLDEQIRAVQDKSEAAQKQLVVLAEHKAYLAKLEQFVAPTASAELTRGVLDADTLKTLSTFLYEQRQSASGEELRLALEQRGLKEQLEVLGRERAQLTAGSARTLREAVVFVNLRGAEGNRLRLRYLVDSATWTPSYSVRASGDDKQVQVEYYASIQQMTGEDWGDVAMTLSTATPSLVARAPTMQPLEVSLAAGGAGGAGQERVLDATGYATAKEEIRQRKLQVENQRNVKGTVQTMQSAAVAVQQAEALPVDADVTLNALASQMQLLDLTVSGIRPMRSAGGGTQEGVSVTYELPARTSMPSRSDQQLIQIAALSMSAEFYRLAAPVLTSYVYHEAGVTNGSQMVLLAGPVSAYRAGQFVGQGEIPTVAAGERFTLGFGIDTSLRARRELSDKKETTQGGNRVAEFTYVLTVENFGAAPADVRLMDRLPVSKDNDVRVELVSAGSGGLSTDETYLQTERKKGLLRWDIQVPAQAIGTKALTVEHKLRLEYDKQMSIASR